MPAAKANKRTNNTPKKAPKKPAARSENKPAGKLTWPEGLNETPTRQLWLARLKSLPPGLTVRAAADRLRRQDSLVYFWMKVFGYAPADGMADRRAAGDAKWAGVDWGETDAAIAAKVGVSSAAVRLQRQRRHVSPPAGSAAGAGG